MDGNVLPELKAESPEDHSIIACIRLAYVNGYPQTKTILEHLSSARDAKLTAYTAALHFGVFALPKRITEIEAMGVPILRTFKKDPRGHRYMAYQIKWPSS